MTPSKQICREETGSARELPPYPSRLLARFPVLRRYPHPLLAHFPIAYLLAAAGCSLLYLFTIDQAFEETAFYCLGAGLLFLPPTILTGFLTHWLNFPGELHRTVVIERRLSLLLLALTAAAFFWRWLDPRVLTNPEGFAAVYLVLILALALLVAATSYFGGMVTFPVDAPPPRVWFKQGGGA